MADIYVQKHLIGGQGGNSFSYTGGTNGKILEKIGVWVGPETIKAIKVWLSDDAPKVFGHASGPYKEFAFQLGERITELSLWGNGQGTRCGAIRFKTNQGRVFDHKMTVAPRKQEYPIDVGSGICVGVVGRAGNDVDQLGFVFLKPIRDSKLTNVHYPTLAQNALEIPPTTLDSFADSNPANNPTETNWTFSGTKTVETSYTFSITVGVEYTTETTAEVEVPELGKAGSKYSWKLSASASFGLTHSEERTLSWSKSGTLKPGRSISLRALTRNGTLSIPFEGTMVVKLKNGKTFSYPVQGIYSGVTYTGVEIATST